MNLWFGQRIVNAPSTPKALTDSSIGHSCLFGPFNKGLCYSGVREQSIISLVSRLLGSRCPFTVVWTVAKRAVNSFYRVFVAGLWFFAHVGKEVFKRISPAFANRNSDGSIKTIGNAGRLIASLPHLDPCDVFRGSRLSMRKRPMMKNLFSTASAGNSASVLYIPESDNLSCPASTDTLNHSAIGHTSYFADDRKLSKCLTDAFYFRSSGFCYNLSSHCRSLLSVIRSGEAPSKVCAFFGAASILTAT